MKRLPILILVLAAALGGCDSPTESRRTVVEVEVSPADDHIPVGSTRQLTASARDAAGTRLNGGVDYSWQSSNPSAVSVSSSGLVTALTAGRATITATSGNGIRGTAEISVAVPLPEACVTISTLDVGGVQTLLPGTGSVLCLEGGATGAEYTVIPFFGSATAGATLALEIANQGGIAPSVQLDAGGSASASLHAVPRSAAPAVPHDQTWEIRLRQREIRELTPLIPTLQAARTMEPGAGPSLSSAAASVVPAVGTRLTLNTNAQKACEEPVNRVGEVVAVTQHAVVVADTDNPAGGFTAEEYAEFGRVFDTLVFPTVTQNFGTPSDIDGNGRVIIFFTRAVNNLSVTANSVVGGFFFSRDLFPRTGTGSQQACTASNAAELLYMMVPDPARASSQSAFSRDNVRRTTPGVMAHEFQHLVNASQRLFVRRTGNFEEVWLNEGLSHVAEELAGFAAAGTAARRNLGYAEISGTTAAWDAYQTYHRSNFGRLAEHLRAPQSTSLYDPAAPLASRGAAWQFLRYAIDRKGGSEAAILRALASSSSTGLRNLQTALGEDPLPLLRDWAVAVYTDDLFAGLDPRWVQPSWNFRSVYQGTRNDGLFPLVTPVLMPNRTTSVPMTAGGAAYLRVAAAPAGRATVRTSVNGLTPPDRLMITVVRTR